MQSKVQFLNELIKNYYTSVNGTERTMKEQKSAVKWDRSLREIII